MISTLPMNYPVSDAFAPIFSSNGKALGQCSGSYPAAFLAWKNWRLPQAVSNLVRLEQGLVLVTGPTGSGKSTTLAAMIDHINQEYDKHIVTIEDPLEFIHPNKTSLVTQREVGTHTSSFATALRAVLREDPDIILIGELRDLETIALAMTAAETGHVVFGTLHTRTPPLPSTASSTCFPQSNRARSAPCWPRPSRG